MCCVVIVVLLCAVLLSIEIYIYHIYVIVANMSNTQVFVGNIIHCTKPYEIELIENGYVHVRDDKVVEIGNTYLANKEDNVIFLENSQILIPGLIDSHIHAPQYPNVGLGYDHTLLDWLSLYTYPTEAKYNDLKFSDTVYSALVNRTLSYGTTTACYFGSLFKESTVRLVEAVIQHGQRALIGKINMITLAPDNYIESREKSISETREYIRYVQSRNNELVIPIISPRFALSVDTELMLQLSIIAKKKNLHIQSHISENIDEVNTVMEEYKTNYATAYDNGGMLTNKTIMAHAIYLDDSELALLKKRGTSVSHCPDSNTLLKSGLCDVRKIQSYGINIGLGTDVSGGASVSIINAMRAAIATSVHISFQKQNYKPLTYEEVFYLATLGGAKALSLDNKIGNFEVGKAFDALIIDMKVDNSSADYFDNCNAKELLQKFVFIGDDRNVKAVFVNGKKVKSRE